MPLNIQGNTLAVSTFIARKSERVKSSADYVAALFMKHMPITSAEIN